MAGCTVWQDLLFRYAYGIMDFRLPKPLSILFWPNCSLKYNLTRLFGAVNIMKMVACVFIGLELSVLFQLTDKKLNKFGL